MRDVKGYTFVSSGKVLAIASSTNAAPIEITTSVAHGFSTGDKVTVNGHATNTAANGTWTITKVDATKFTLDGSTGNGVGGATGCVASFIAPIFVSDFRNLLVSIATDGGGTAVATIKCVGTVVDEDGNEPSPQKPPPDFAAARGVDNFFEFVQMIDKQSSGVGLDGDTGFVVATADDYRLFEVNVNGLAWLSFLPTAGSAGQFTIKGRLFNP